ncbi:MAG: hypothetical protein PHP90_13135, partial [Sulfuricurvum sp.]|uniref:hypothetical protein n=1 Tax=Sulfuricurvum sp. TaxID=2025608 RepID=UPI00262D077F
MMITFFSKQKGILLSVALATFITGCGGGGGGSSASTSDAIFPSSSVSAMATDDNAQQTADALVGGVSSVSVPNTTTLLAVSSDVNTSYTNNQFEIAMKQLKKIKFNEPIALNATASNSETTNCQGGGTETLTYNMTYNEQTYVSTGTVTITSNQCNDGVTTTNGTVKSSSKCTSDANSHELLGCEYMNMSFITDLTTNFTGGTSTTLKDSTFNIANLTVNNGLWSARTNTNTVVVENDKKYGLKEFTADFKELANTQNSMDYVSGSIYFDQLSKYVSIDPSYDCTTTPF